MGCNPRFIVTNLDGHAQALYDDLVCQRGEAETDVLQRTGPAIAA